MNFDFTYYSPLFWFLLIITSITIYFGYRNIFYLSNYKLLSVIRTLSFAILLFIFLDPKFNFSVSKVKELPWNVYIDKSLSMSYHSKPSSVALASGIDNFINQLNRKKIQNNIYTFGSELDTNWSSGGKKFSQGSTNLGMVLDHIKSNKNKNSAGSVIITDGQANLGKELEIENFDFYKPIHIIGVGNTSPFVDVAIKSIDAPPVIIKGESAELIVSITYSGDPNKKLNITLYSQNKLMGSKVISSSGNNSVDKVRFMVKPDQTGKIEYRVQVNSIADEINIQNNKQVVSMHVLKNMYRIAIITGAPNFNTQILKKNIFNNSKIEFDHFIYRNNNYSIPIKKFWDTKYDLIIFDNHPIDENADEWSSYLRVFAKKILSQKTSLALIAGYDIQQNIFESYLKLMELNYKKSIIKLESEFPWEITENWERTFPFISSSFTNKYQNNFPPIYVGINIEPNNANVLANFSISEMKVPLLLLSEKGPLRFAVWTSPDLNQLRFKTHNKISNNFFGDFFNPIITWLMRTNNEKFFYFRSMKNSYQQGEQILVVGKPIIDSNHSTEGYIHVFSNDSLINTKQLFYDSNKKNYQGKFWASKAGKLDYKIEMFDEEKSRIVSEGEIHVQESQIELNKVFLNELPLKKLANQTNGTFNLWDSREELINNIEKKIEKTVGHTRLVLKEKIGIVIFLFMLVSIEWFLRRRLGLL
ncbi:MAG: hypothetical protein CMF99_09450 [Candidatus Marinimicrobia bacterium]|nr:hypothetical protein [Candidatus Neomarinimicrobiota bacterium]